MLSQSATPGMAAAVLAACGEPQAADPTLWLYRDRTTALLRRYFRLSVELGRLPSLLGREFFRSRITSYRMHSFEDVVIFVHDVERCLERLDSFSQALIARLVLQEYTQEEAAPLLRCARRTIARRLPQAVDRLTRVFLDCGLLQALPDVKREDGAPFG